MIKEPILVIDDAPYPQTLAPDLVGQGYRVALESDNQFEAALEHLGEAQDFWIAWQDTNLD